MRLSYSSWVSIALSLGLAHCATAVVDEPQAKPPTTPSGGASSATGGVAPTGGIPATGGAFVAATGGVAASGGRAASGGSSVGGGAGRSGGSGGRAASSGGSAPSGGRAMSGGAGGGLPSAGKGGTFAQGGSPGGASSAGGSAPAGTCIDDQLNGTETDVDCGGGTCAPCLGGDTCKTDTDCTGTQCIHLTCAPNHCGDRTTSGDESDSDCGGSCDPCALGKTCVEPSDCQNNSCSAGTCGAPSTHCAAGWADDPCGASCLERTQADQRACELVLDCFVENDCGPSTCTGATQACGANALQQGGAPYPYATTVYNCLCQ